MWQARLALKIIASETNPTDIYLTDAFIQSHIHSFRSSHRIWHYIVSSVYKYDQKTVSHQADIKSDLWQEL